MDIVIATKNNGKIAEINDFFKFRSIKHPQLRQIRWLTFKDFAGFPEIIEGSRSFLENAALKAEGISNFTGKPALADDSGLEVQYLGGAPGVISSRFAGENAGDEENRKKLLAQLTGAADPEKRKAKFVCCMVLHDPLKGILNISTGICRGTIGFEEKGTGGFGYDSIFIPGGYGLTMAEIGPEEKNRISHRAKALEKLALFLVSFLQLF